MDFLQIASAVAALTFVALALVLIPVLLEVKRTVISVRNLTDSLQAEVPALVQDLRDTIAEVQVVTGSAAARVDGVNLLMDEIGHVGHNLLMINKVMGIAATLVSNSSTWATGAKVAGKYIADRLIKKGGNCHVRR